MKYKYFKGFTLIEMLVAVAILAVIMGLAAPSIQDILIKNRINKIASEFQSGVLLARSEAANKNICMTMCMSDTSRSPLRCKTTDSDWQVGWIVFLNPSCESSLAQPSNANDVIHVRQTTSSEYYLQSQASSSTRRIFFTPNPATGLNSADEFDLIYQSSNNKYTEKFGVNICLDSLGRTRTIPSTASCANYK